MRHVLAVVAILCVAVACSSSDDAGALPSGSAAGAGAGGSAAGAAGASGAGAGGAVAGAAGASAGAGGGGAAGGAGVDDRLFRYLEGRFDSSAQASTDKSYFAIQLLTCRVQAPAQGPLVLYVEQARMDSLTAPYRQRLYVIEPGKDAGTARSRVFEFANPKSVVGLCAHPDQYDPGTVVEERAGCAVSLAWDGAAFHGGTVGKACESSLMGATYATSEVSVRADGLTSWDRGFDGADKQVWGAVKGPYQFVRMTPLAP